MSGDCQLQGGEGQDLSLDAGVGDGEDTSLGFFHCLYLRVPPTCRASVSLLAQKNKKRMHLSSRERGDYLPVIPAPWERRGTQPNQGVFLQPPTESSPHGEHAGCFKHRGTPAVSVSVRGDAVARNVSGQEGMQQH